MVFYYKRELSFLVIWACLLIIPGVALGLQKDNYKMGPGDQIEIRVYGEEDLTISTLLSENGVINYPFLGELKATGLSPMELESIIVAGLKGDYLVSPIVHVSIVEYRPFFIDGEVRSPGAYPFQPGLTAGKAVALARGFTERASREKIYIVRYEGGKENETIEAKLSTYLMPGDVVTVKQRFF